MPIHPLRLCREVRDFIDRDTILTVDGHEILNFARQSIPSYQPFQRINSGTHGTMGVGVPFAIGAQAAYRNKRVVLLTGDGAFGWNGMEIDTAVRHKLPVIIVICNNANLTAASPEMVDPKRFLGWTRYDKMMEALGGHGEWVEDPTEIRPALERAARSGKPAVVNVKVDQFVHATTQIGIIAGTGARRVAYRT
jgi:thiamine pyrophosphate-dependent acetolactate synthase large subunit-like protein